MRARLFFMLNRTDLHDHIFFLLTGQWEAPSSRWLMIMLCVLGKLLVFFPCRLGPATGPRGSARTTSRRGEWPTIEWASPSTPLRRFWRGRASRPSSTPCSCRRRWTPLHRSAPAPPFGSLFQRGMDPPGSSLGMDDGSLIFLAPPALECWPQEREKKPTWVLDRMLAGWPLWLVFF